MACSVVSKGSLAFLKVYFIWHFQEENVFLGSPVISAAELVLHQKTRRLFLSSLSRQISVPALSRAKANQVQSGLHSCRKLMCAVTAVTWLPVRSWRGWWQETFSIACKSAKHWYSLGLRSSESQVYGHSGGFSNVLSTLICGCSDLWGRASCLFVGPQNQRPLSKVGQGGTSSSLRAAGKMLSCSSTYRGVLQLF